MDTSPKTSTILQQEPWEHGTHSSGRNSTHDGAVRVAMVPSTQQHRPGNQRQHRDHGSIPRRRALPENQLVGTGKPRCWTFQMLSGMTGVYRYLEFPTALKLNCTTRTTLLLLQAFFNYNASKANSDSGYTPSPGLSLAVYDPRLTLSSALANSYTRMVDINASGMRASTSASRSAATSTEPTSTTTTSPCPRPRHSIWSATRPTITASTTARARRVYFCGSRLSTARSLRSRGP